MNTPKSSRPLPQRQALIFGFVAVLYSNLRKNLACPLQKNFFHLARLNI
jgi:hypothetical protein